MVVNQFLYEIKSVAKLNVILVIVQQHCNNT